MVSRNYCWTLNNWTDEECEVLRTPGRWRYIVWGREVGEEGTPHLQGYIELSKPQRITGIKKWGGPYARMHLETRRGTRLEAKNYCLEDGDWEEHGDWNAGGQGTRTDLDKVRNLAIGGGMREVTLTSNLQQIRVAEKYLTYHEEPRDFKPHVEWYWGPTGTGKSRAARNNCSAMDCYTKNTPTKWWNGYDGHEAVIIDDFRDSWWSLTDMLSLLDRYERQVETKGGERQFRASVIVVTSAHSPETLYKGCGEDVQQLLRRIDIVTEFRNEVGGVILSPPTPSREDNISEPDYTEILAEFL